jgi:hypothetical protein
MFKMDIIKDAATIEEINRLIAALSGTPGKVGLRPMTAADTEAHRRLMQLLHGEHVGPPEQADQRPTSGHNLVPRETAPSDRPTKRPLNGCGDCGHSWFPKGSDLSRRCPGCGSGKVGIKA